MNKKFIEMKKAPIIGLDQGLLMITIYLNK